MSDSGVYVDTSVIIAVLYTARISYLRYVRSYYTVLSYVILLIINNFYCLLLQTGFYSLTFLDFIVQYLGAIQNVSNFILTTN